MTNDQKNREVRSLNLAVGAYTSIFLLKLVAYLLTGVIALFAEALHSMTDILISIFLLFSVKWSQKQADLDHQFGHGRAQNVAALVASTLFLSFTSYKLYETAIPRLFRPEEVEFQNLSIAFGVIIVSMLINALPLIRLLGQKNRGSAAKAQLLDLANDELGLTAALIGTLFLQWGFSIADPIAAIIVATIIAINAIFLFRENVSFLMGRSPDPEFLNMVKELALSVPGVLDIHELRAEYIGPETVHSGMHIVVERGILIEKADEIADEVRRRVHKVIGCQYCVIHVDAAKESAQA
jgi:cation diffusion facilitator family transporter